ncbi:MAG: AzlD domain-containing protein [Anaerolineales bacterium]|nr:AzlD domain-containing protein [Anaerolineales bacterium]
MALWLTVFAMGAVTYAIRLSLLGAIGRVQLPPLLVRGLRYVPPAVLTAIVAPELMLPGGTLDISWTNARLVAGALAALVAWRSRNVIWTGAAGMVALWGLTALLGG